MTTELPPLPEPRLWYDPETQRVSHMVPLRPTYESLFDESDLQAYARTALEAQAARIATLEAEVAEWRRLRDPATLHVNLLRGFPAKLPRDVFLHIAGDDPQDARAAFAKQA